jgi:hypothetical protein
VQYYSPLKINELANHRGHGGNLKSYYLVKKASLRKATCYIVPSIGHPGQNKTRKKVKRSLGRGRSE